MVLAGLLIAASIIPALAEDDAEKKGVTINDVFERFGFTTSGMGSSVPCHVTGAIDKKTFLRQIPLLQSMGMLNRDLTQTDINAKPTMLTMAWALQMAPVVTKEIFENNPKVNSCALDFVVKEYDVYGHMVDSKLFAYTFDRATFKKIDWDHFESQNMAAVAHNFSLDPSIMARVERETK
jgi:hypothetical protein